MPFSLHSALVPSWLQILGAGRGWLDKAADCGLDESSVVDARLVEDMFPFSYQVKSMAVHSQGAIEAVRQGVFTPNFAEALPGSLSELRERLDGAIALLESVGEDELDSFVGKPMRFEIGEKRLDFTAEDFLLSFSQPNFYFHASTAYGILRAKGVKVGKLDYLGKLRLAQPA
ncbi:DUF1993 family protein [Altererythrobacter sp. Root672]|uniref:DUF1993 domain-containing protein n=1 Tax=Altererythrobacter sp. Root672 TaxID=1736584 RepID=UPI0006F3AF94|nr:DUF1993 domain-containing protein [Altererythrobacter sp. Root672]KRA84120.1 hypothetical protein ASD76_09030 [Altererythrobacter sp. Root672]